MEEENTYPVGIIVRAMDKYLNGSKPGDGIVDSCLLDAVNEGDIDSIYSYVKCRSEYDKDFVDSDYAKDLIARVEENRK